MPQATFSLTKKQAVHSDSFCLDTLDVDVQGELPDIIQMIIEVMKEHPDVITILSSAVMTHHVRNRTAKGYIMHMRLADALTNGMTDNDDKRGPGT